MFSFLVSFLSTRRSLGCQVAGSGSHTQLESKVCCYPGSRGSLRGKKKRETTSVTNPTSTLDYVQNLNLACDWPFLKICQPVWEINITVS